MADAASIWKSRRFLIWGGLALLLIVSVVLLLTGLASRRARAPAAPTETPSDAAPSAPLVVRVVDSKGRPVGDAHVFVAQEPGDDEKAAGSWDAARATLTLPATGVPRSLAVQARGYRSVEVPEVRTDQTVVLRRGHVIRVRVTGDPVLPGPPYRLTFQVRPLPATLPDAERDTLLDLMDALAPLAEGVVEMPRTGFGYVVTASQADAGIVVPRPGRYALRWGLLEDQRGRWYSLTEGTTLDVEVDTDSEATVVDVAVSTTDVERTRRELEATFK